MKTILTLLIILFSLKLTANTVWISKVETFENVSYAIKGDGSEKQVTGTSGVTYTQGVSTKPVNITGASTVNGSNAMLLRYNNGVLGYIEFPLVNGVNELKFYYVRAFSDGGDACGVKVTLANQTNTHYTLKKGVVDSVVFTGLNYIDSTVLRIQLLGDSVACVIDSIVWTEQESDALPDSPHEVKTLNLNGLSTYRLGVLNKGDEEKQKVIGTTYNYEVYATNLMGDILWKDRTGGFCFDICTGDISGDESEEVILGCADDSVYCYNGEGNRLWSTGLQSGPVCAVASIKAGDEKFILAGTVLNYVFVLNPEGEIISKHKFIGAIREILVHDFDRDGTEDVYINRAPKDAEQYGNIYAFPSLTQKSNFSEVDLGISRNDHGQNAVLLTKENGEALIFDDEGYIDPLEGMKRVMYDNSGFAIEKDEYASGYRARYLSCGKYRPGINKKQVAMAYGDDVFLYSAEGVLLSYGRADNLSFNDVATVTVQGQDKMVFASAPNGDDNLYMVKADSSGTWLSQLTQLDWIGRMKHITDEYATIQKDIKAWDGVTAELPSDKPLIVQVNGTQGNGLNENTMEEWISIWKEELAYYYEKFPYPDRIKFAFRVQLYEDWTGYFQYQNPDGTWVTDPKEPNKALSKETLIKFAQRMEEEGIPFYSKAHGVQISIDTYKAMMDAAPNAYLGVGIVEYGFGYNPFEVDEKGKQDFFIRDFMLPLMDYAKEKGKNVWFHNKGAVWAVRTQMSWFQTGIMAEKYKDVLIMSNEDSNSRTPDLNTAGRVGAWYAGYVNNWGYRWVSDIPAFSRFWDWSRTNTGHPASRSLLTAVSLGANYLNICSRQYDQVKREEMPSMSAGVEQFIHLLGKGIIAPPKRENLLNISPVTLSMEEDIIDDIYWTSGGHSFIKPSQTNQGYTQTDGFGIMSKLGPEWGTAPTPETDWSAYAYGRYQQAHNHIPNLYHGYGYAPIVPNPVERPDVDISYFSTQVETDGAIVKIDNETLTLTETREQVLDAMAKGTENKEMFPVLVQGNVFASINRIAENHYLIYLIDPKLMSPGNDITCSIVANKTGIWTVKDRISNEEIGNLEQVISVDIPSGTFRILELTLENGSSNNSLNHGNNIEVFPNPVSDKLNIIIDDKMPNISLVINDLSGKKVYNQSIRNKNNVLDFSSYSPGIYILNFSQDYGSEVQKIVKH